MTVSKTRLANFLTLLQAATDRYFHAKFKNLDAPEISFAGGRKYLKIVRKDNQTMVWGFIALVDVPAKGVKVGDILQAASFNAPAFTGARSTIFDEDVISKVSYISPGYQGGFTYDPWEGVDVSDLKLVD